MVKNKDKKICFKNWFDISSLIFSILAIVLTILGLMFTISQTKSAKTSAIASKNSSKTAQSVYNFQKENSKKELANKIAVWDADRNSNGNNKNEIIIQNDSNLPIYDVSVFIVRNDNKNTSIKKLKIDKNEYSFAEVFPPNKTNIFLNGKPDIGPKHDNVAIIFKDANGNYWYRDVRGNLKSISKKELNDFYKQTDVDYDERSKNYSPHIKP